MSDEQGFDDWLSEHEDEMLRQFVTDKGLMDEFGLWVSCMYGSMQCRTEEKDDI